MFKHLEHPIDHEYKILKENQNKHQLTNRLNETRNEKKLNYQLSNLFNLFNQTTIGLLLTCLLILKCNCGNC